MKKYLSLVAFSHTIFALPFAIIGFILGVKVSGGFSVLLFVKVLLCMLTARSAAMAFNRWADREIDAKNPRTAVREIPSGAIKANNALLLTIICSLIFMAITFTINNLVFALSPVALLVILGYSYTKRFTALCHLILGLGLSLAPIGAYLCLTGEFALLPCVFSVLVLTWVSGFDIIYALQDDAFDKQNNLNSIPALLGRKNALFVSTALHIVSASALLYAYWLGGFGWFYLVGAFGFLCMLVYQHLLVKPTDLSKVNRAFMTANGIASVVFMLFFLADYLF